MRYLKLQIAILSLLAVNAGWLVGADKKHSGSEHTGSGYPPVSEPHRRMDVNGSSGFESFPETHAAAEAKSILQDGKDSESKRFFPEGHSTRQQSRCQENNYSGCRFDQNNNNMVLDWWSQVKMATINTLITNVGFPLGIKALEKTYEFYEQRSDPKGYAKKKAAEKKQDKAQKQLENQMLIAQQALHGALVVEKKLAGQHTAMQLMQIQRQEVEGFVAGYERKIKDILKRRDEILMSNISEVEKKEFVEAIEDQLLNCYQKIAGFNQTYDKLATLTIIASDIDTPGKLEAFGREIKEQKQLNKKKKKPTITKPQQTLQGESKGSSASPYDAIDALLSTELEKVESKLQEDGAKLDDVELDDVELEAQSE